MKLSYTLLQVVVASVLACGSSKGDDIALRQQAREAANAQLALDKLQLASAYGADTGWQARLDSLTLASRKLTIDLQDFLPVTPTPVLLTGLLIDAARQDNGLTVWFLLDDYMIDADVQLDCPLTVRDSIKGKYVPHLFIALLSEVTPVLTPSAVVRGSVSEGLSSHTEELIARPRLRGRCLMIKPVDR